MGPNRVGGTSPNDPKEPDRRTQEQHRKLSQVEKVKNVDETENEQRTRKKFRSFMDEDTDESKDASAPSPFETDFHKTEQAGEKLFDEVAKPVDDLADMADKAVSDPNHARAPNVNEMPKQAPEKNALPQGHEFYHETNTSSDHKKEEPKIEDSNETKKEREKKEKLLEDQKKEQLKKSDKDVFAAPIDKEKTIQAGIKKTPLDEEEELKARPQTKKAKEKDRSLAPLHPESHFEKGKKLQKDQDDEGRQGAKDPHTIEIESPSQTQLPPSVVPIAQAATAQATPYLSGEISPLFFQMVGTIHVMSQTSGVNRTEIDLNAPSFANSKYFGSKIMIEKYATAPDSLNIRLTGPDEAVQSFSQNLSNLYAAFENGKFDFRIGRITAEYRTDKPVFKRRGERDSDQRGSQ